MFQQQALLPIKAISPASEFYLMRHFPRVYFHSDRSRVWASPASLLLMFYFNPISIPRTTSSVSYITQGSGNSPCQYPCSCCRDNQLKSMLREHILPCWLKQPSPPLFKSLNLWLPPASLHPKLNVYRIKFLFFSTVNFLRAGIVLASLCPAPLQGLAQAGTCSMITNSLIGRQGHIPYWHSDSEQAANCLCYPEPLVSNYIPLQCTDDPPFVMTFLGLCQM